MSRPSGSTGSGSAVAGSTIGFDRGGATAGRPEAGPPLAVAIGFTSTTRSEPGFPAAAGASRASFTKSGWNVGTGSVRNGLAELPSREGFSTKPLGPRSVIPQRWIVPSAAVSARKRSLIPPKRKSRACEAAGVSGGSGRGASSRTYIDSIVATAGLSSPGCDAIKAPIGPASGSVRPAAAQSRLTTAEWRRRSVISGPFFRGAWHGAAGHRRCPGGHHGADV